MKNKGFYFLAILAFSGAFTMQSCKIEGCTDNKAINYDGKANTNDGSCEYLDGCTDVTAINYNYQAGTDDGSCKYEGQGVFWIQQLSANDTITVSINGTPMGYITKSFNHAPDCDATGAVTITIDPGMYKYSAISKTGLQWQDSVYIYKNFCTPFQLASKK